MRLLVVLIALLPSISMSETPNVIALEDWVVGATAFIASPADSSPETRESALIFHGYLMGTLAGYSMSFNRDEDSHKLTSIPDWMEDPEKAAPSILAFIRRHKPKDGDHANMPASFVMKAWYVFNHPKGGIAERLAILVGLSQFWGPDFPGADELTKKAGENYSPAPSNLTK